MSFTFPVPDIPENTNKLQESKVNPVKSIDSEITSISDRIERYLINLSPATKQAYRTDFIKFIDFTKCPFQNTNEDDVLKYIKFLEEQGQKPATINRKLASLSKLYSIYLTMKLISYHPIHNLSALGKLYKSVDKSVSIGITLHDIEAVCANSNKRTALIVKFLANTGVRISELINITKNDIEPYDENYLRIKLTHTKNKKIRFVFIAYDFYKEIKDVYDGDSLYLFASRSEKPLSRVNLYKQIKRSFLKHCFKETHPHDLRHFFCRYSILEKKKDYKAVSKYVGHSSVQITLDTYVASELSPSEASIL